MSTQLIVNYTYLEKMHSIKLIFHNQCYKTPGIRKQKRYFI